MDDDAPYTPEERDAIIDLVTGLPREGLELLADYLGIDLE